MALAAWWYPAVFGLNVVLGVLLVIGVFAFMERQIRAGAVGGIVVGVAVVYAEATYGERALSVTVGEMKLLVIAAALGAVVGVVGAVLTVEPEV
jgi:hypothetical protein